MAARSARAATGPDAHMARMGAPQEMIDLQHKTEPWQRHHIKYEQVKAWGLLNPRPADQQAARKSHIAV